MYYGHVSTASNRADWQEAVVLTDEDTGELIDISLCRITLSIVKMARSRPDDYGGQNGYNNAVSLTGSTDTGEITLPDVGTFQWIFFADQMAGLPPGEYQIGVRITQDTRTVQLIIGTVNILEGIDQQ